MRMSTTAARMLARAGTGLLAAWLLSLPASAASEPQAAVWTPRQVLFVYHGFSTHFSCDGLRDTMRAILLKLGASPDLSLSETGCGGPTPGVAIKMRVLTPAQGEGSAVVARWKDVNLLAHQNGIEASAQCELLQLVKEKILPLFTVRNLDYEDASCLPHTDSLAPTLHFRAQVLVAEPAPGE